MMTDTQTYKGWQGIKRAFGTPSAATMMFFGFGCGLPFLLIVGGTLSTWLRDIGLALSLIGLLSFASFFYVLKFLWAPLLDRYALPFLGRRRGWLIASQFLLLLALLAMAFTNPTLNLSTLIAFVALAAFAGATQDILVDAYRIEIADLHAQGALAATYTLGYRIGLILGGAIALYFAELFGWKITYIAMAALMLLPIIATLLAKEPVTVAVRRNIDLAEAFLEPFKEFFGRNGILLALAFLLFVGLFKFPDQMIGVLAGPFYLDSGYTKADIATVSKLYGVWLGIGGAFLGGICVAMFDMRKLLAVAAVGVAISNLAFLLMAQNPSEIWAFFAAITADNLANGFAGTILVAFMSSLTNQNFTATQYALLVSLANLPGKFVGGFSGYIVEQSSYSAFFLISVVSVVPALLLLAWLWKKIDTNHQA
jgi:PAT family beta-lactamase induction signal transducer AmpG